MVAGGSSRPMISYRSDCFISKDEHQPGKFWVRFQEWCRLLKVTEVLYCYSLCFCIVHYTHLFSCANQLNYFVPIHLFLYCCSDCCIKYYK